MQKKDMGELKSKKKSQILKITLSGYFNEYNIVYIISGNMY